MSEIKNLQALWNNLSNAKTKEEIAITLIKSLSSILSPRFISFVDKSNDSLRVLCQIGNSEVVKEKFGNDISNEIYNWVISQKTITTINTSDENNFAFIPLTIESKSEHGVLVLHLDTDFKEINDERKTLVKFLCNLAESHIDRLSGSDLTNKLKKIQSTNESEVKLVKNLQQSIIGLKKNRKIIIDVLEDESTDFKSNFWWINDLTPDMTLVLIAQIELPPSISSYKGLPSAMLHGFFIGEMNGLKAKAELSLNPVEAMKYLNNQLNPVFLNTGITVNTWYGVFNVAARTIRYSSANHPEPYIIGLEQQVSTLVSRSKSKSLGIDLGTNFYEDNAQVALGSKLVICTKSLLDDFAKIGNHYDSKWFPTLLETLGNQSVNDMCNSLKQLLSESNNGTGYDHSRLALLLEFAS